jgi:hypothetical protein
MKYNSRFFAFGCSSTWSVSRPTWADIVGREFAFYQNWARPGSGNQYIFQSLIECSVRHKFTPDDTVMIMWTSISREDRYIKDQGGWVGQGNVYNQTLYGDDFIRKYSCERGYLIRDLNTITATINLLKYWGVKYKLLAVLPVIHPSELREDLKTVKENQDVVDLYADTLAEISPSQYEVIFNSQNWNEKHSDFGAYVHDGIRDPHADPIEALEYVQKIIPEIELSQETIDWVHNFKLGTKNENKGIKRL